VQTLMSCLVLSDLQLDWCLPKSAFWRGPCMGESTRDHSAVGHGYGGVVVPEKRCGCVVPNP
jgi:hypothetical protein